MTQEDASQDEELLSFRKFWLGAHGCKCIKEWLQQGADFKPPWPPTASRPWPPLVAEWCQGCDDIPLSDLLVEVKGLVVPGKLKEGVGRREEAVKEEQFQRESRGEMNPPFSPGQGVQKSRSPGSQAKNLTRLLMFQQQLCEEVGCLRATCRRGGEWSWR